MSQAAEAEGAGRPLVDVVLPVYNEEHDLPRSVETLLAYLGRHLPYPWRITVADNGSTDATPAIAGSLAQAHPQVRVVHLTEKGRGRALKRAWLDSDADILVYMDIDLSTDLACLLPLVDAVYQGRHLAVGSRLARGARVDRALKREVISRCYVLLIRAFFQTRFTDAQCGFKAISRGAAQALLPHVRDNGWFFDTELLVTAEKRGFRIADIPVAWRDDPDTRVAILSTAWRDLKGLLRLRFGGLAPVTPPGRDD